MTAALLILGTVLLVVDAESMVRGASKLAAAAGVSPLVVGLTVVAFGTSSPELAVSTHAAFTGEADIAIGNVVGSNIFNILAVAGLTGLVAPDGVSVSVDALRFDIPVMILVALGTAPALMSGMIIQRWEGFLFLAYYLAYLAHLILAAAGHSALPGLDSVVLSLMVPLTALAVLVFHWQKPAKD